VVPEPLSPVYEIEEEADPATNAKDATTAKMVEESEEADLEKANNAERPSTPERSSSDDSSEEPSDELFGEIPVKRNASKSVQLQLRRGSTLSRPPTGSVGGNWSFPIARLFTRSETQPSVLPIKKGSDGSGNDDSTGSSSDDFGSVVISGHECHA